VVLLVKLVVGWQITVTLTYIIRVACQLFCSLPTPNPRFAHGLFVTFRQRTPFLRCAHFGSGLYGNDLAAMGSRRFLNSLRGTLATTLRGAKFFPVFATKCLAEMPCADFLGRFAN
jgi:hypothetical protein